jgi:hypothetical protein
MRHMLHLLGPAALGLLIGCAPSLSTFQPAHVAPKGHFQMGAGIEMSIAPGSISDAVDTAKSASKKIKNEEPVTYDDKLAIFDGGIRLLLNPPLSIPAQHLMLAYVPLEHLEVSVRWAGGAWRLGTRYQILSQANGPFDLTVGLGASRFTYEFPMGDVIPVLKLDDFSRWAVDVPILIGTSRDWFRVWAGPKFLVTWFGTKLRFEIPSVKETDLATFDGHAYYFGAQGGVALGYKYVFLAFELTTMQMLGTAHSRTILGTAEPLSRDTSLSGFVVFPSFGLIGEF